MIAFVCEVIQLLWTLTLFVGSIVFLALVDARNLADDSCRRSRYNNALVFSIIALCPLIVTNVLSVRYRWHMKVRRERTRAWFQDVAKRKLQGALHLRRMGPGAPEAEAEPLGEPANLPPRPRQQRHLNRRTTSSQ